MSCKNLCDLCFEILFRLTLKHSAQISKIEDVRLIIFEIWRYIAILPLKTSTLYHQMLNKYAHALSHDCKTSYNDLCHLPNLRAEEAFNLLITCQSPYLSFDYRMNRQKMDPEEIILFTEHCSIMRSYFQNSLIELNLSGTDFCCDDTLLIQLLPQCHSLQVLCLGNGGSDEVLNAAKLCPLRKLQLEERFPLHPKLPQDTVLKYLLGYQGNYDELNDLLEVCKHRTLLENVVFEENEEARIDRMKSLTNFLSRCKPCWPDMKILIFGNCRICREASILCLLVLKYLEEILIDRIQSDEILNTCERVFNAFGLVSQISIRRVVLWAKWSGFRNDILRIAPNIDTLCLVAYGYSNLHLQNTVEKNSTLNKVSHLSLVGLRHAGPSIFKETTPFLAGLKNLEISGVILTTEEIVNVLFCIPNLLKLQLEYSELRNYNFVISDRKHPSNLPLTQFLVETSYIDRECIKAIFTMAENIEHLSIRGRTRSFALSFAHQEIFLHSSNLRINYLELYPQYPLDIPGLVSLAKRMSESGKRLRLSVPLSSLTQHESSILRNNGWYIIPACSRC